VSQFDAARQASARPSLAKAGASPVFAKATARQCCLAMRFHAKSGFEFQFQNHFAALCGQAARRGNGGHGFRIYDLMLRLLCLPALSINHPRRDARLRASGLLMLSKGEHPTAIG